VRALRERRPVGRQARAWITRKKRVSIGSPVQGSLLSYLTDQSPTTTSGDPDWLRALHPDDRPGILDTLKAAREARSAFILRPRIRADDGQYRHIRAWAIPEYAQDGTVAGFTITIYPDAALERRRQRRTTVTNAQPPTPAAGSAAFGPQLIAVAHDG
jgi:hypothetical protein